MSALILKLIAAVSMLVDHTGMMFFPSCAVFRYVGRLAFPIFAYFIAEGFRYTHSRWKYFLRVSLLGTVCQIVYTIAEGEVYIGILLTFSMSIAVMACVELVKNAIKKPDEPVLNKIYRPTVITLSSMLCAFSVGAVYFICSKIEVDYGFFGVMLPVLVSLFEDKRLRIAMFTLGVIAVCLSIGGVFGDFSRKDLITQSFSALTVPLMLLYNGKPGKYRMKYFFYIFYPAHLALLYLISILI